MRAAHVASPSSPSQTLTYFFSRAALSTDPLLVWNYGVMAVLAGCAGTIFWFQYRHLDEQEDALNAIGEGHYEEKQ